jgi:hypothetical protein
MVSPEELEGLKAQWDALSEEDKQDILQRAQELRASVEDQGKHILPMMRDPEGRTLTGIPRRPLMRGSNLDPATPEGKANTAMLAAAGAGGAARTLVGGARAAGLPGLAKAGGGLAKKAAVYSGVGAAASQLPVVGSGDPVEGAKYGAFFALGQGGKGALWKHHKRKGLIESVSKWLLKQFGGEADTAAKEVVEEVVKGVPKGMSTTASTAVRQADEVAAAATRGSPRLGARSTTPAPSSAPAPPASPGAVRSAAHAAERKVLVAFAKPLAKSHKFGEKVWLELNKAGEPIRVMTPGQASRVAESAKTWIKKLWRD